jgi:hypothetical protein
MNVLEMFDKLDDIIYEPIKLFTDWAREPLKDREHKRSIEASIAEHDIKTKEQKNTAEIEMRHKDLDASLEIKKQTEVQRIISEIEELRKDNEFQRMKKVSEAIMEYQKHLTKLNVNAINAIGNMQLDLREKAQELVYDKTMKYKKLQDESHNQAEEEMLRIEKNFADNEAAKSMLYRSVDARLANIITTAQNFLVELNEDIKLLNSGINLLTEKGQSFIDNHLNQFHSVTSNKLENGNTYTIEKSSGNYIGEIKNIDG